MNRNATDGGYISVAVRTATGTDTYSVSVSNNVYSITTDQKLGSTNTYNEANQLRYNNLASNEVCVGDMVIWMGSEPTAANWVNSGFIVDLGNTTIGQPNYDLWLNDTAAFLWNDGRFNGPNPGLYQQITAEQGAPAPNAETRKLTVKQVGLPDNKSWDLTVPVGSNQTYNFSLAPYTATGYTLSSVTPVAGGTVLGATVSCTDTTNFTDYTLTNIAPSSTGDDVITLNYTMTPTSLAVTLSEAAAGDWAPVTVNYAVTGANAGTISTYGAAQTVNTGVAYGNNFLLTWTGKTGVAYTINSQSNAGSATITQDGNVWTVKGKVNGAATIDILATYTPPAPTAYNVTWNIPESVAVTGGAATTTWANNYTATIGAAAGWSTGAITVNVTDTDTGTVVPSTYSAGSLTINAADGAGKNVTITVTAANPAKVPFTITVANVSNEGASWSLEGVNSAFTGAAAVANSTFNMEVGQTLYVYTNNNKIPSVGTIVPTTSTDNDGRTVYIFDGINAAATLTIN